LRSPSPCRPIGEIAFQNKAVVNNLRFRAVCASAADPKHLGAEISLVLLHTGGRASIAIPVHCGVPGGGPSPHRTR
jgi:hypothetical protein